MGKHDAEIRVLRGEIMSLAQAMRALSMCLLSQGKTFYTLKELEEKWSMGRDAVYAHLVHHRAIRPGRTRQDRSTIRVHVLDVMRVEEAICPSLTGKQTASTSFSGAGPRRGSRSSLLCNAGTEDSPEPNKTKGL